MEKKYLFGTITYYLIIYVYFLVSLILIQFDARSYVWLHHSLYQWMNQDKWSHKIKITLPFLAGLNGILVSLLNRTAETEEGDCTAKRLCVLCVTNVPGLLIAPTGISPRRRNPEEAL